MDPLANEDQSTNPDDANIEADAEQTELQGDTERFSGGVTVSQGDRQFRVDEATINRETGEAILD